MGGDIGLNILLQLRNGRVVELHGAHHYLFISHESEVMREMAAFLDSPVNPGGQ